MPMARKAKNPTGPARATTARTTLTMASQKGRILVFQMMTAAAAHDDRDPDGERRCTQVGLQEVQGLGGGRESCTWAYPAGR